MSKVSAKTRYEAFQEWHAWAKTKYPSFRTQRKKAPVPVWMGNMNDEY